MPQREPSPIISTPTRVEIVRLFDRPGTWFEIRSYVPGGVRPGIQWCDGVPEMLARVDRVFTESSGG